MLRPFVMCCAVTTLLACGSGGKCDLPGQLLYQAGDGAIDCGRAAEGDTEAVDECVIAAFGQSAAFYARYDFQGEDSKLTLGLVRDPSGDVTVFQLDEDPGGGVGNVGQVIETYGCTEPMIDAERERTPPNVSALSCKSYPSLGRACG